MDMLVLAGKVLLALWLLSPLPLIFGFILFSIRAARNPGDLCLGACGECDAHLRCTCPHHDREIMRAMESSGTS